MIKFINIKISWESDTLDVTIAFQPEDALNIYGDYLDYLRGRAKKSQGIAEGYADTDNTSSVEKRRHANKARVWAKRDTEDFTRSQELYSCLAQACRKNEDTILDGKSYGIGSDFPSWGILDKKFASISCPTCNQKFNPGECQVVRWVHGESLFAEGGRRLLCPADHTLYWYMDWNS
jgi:hypothetical protein